MIFAEKKTDKGYSYNVEDVFGTIDIESTYKLDGKTLDSVVMGVLHSGGSQGAIGEMITFTFAKRPLWEDEDENEIVDVQVIQKPFYRELFEKIKNLWKSHLKR